MTWVKIDEQFADHPKVAALGKDRLAGVGLWLVGACYCNRFLTDGFIPVAVLPARSAKLAQRLVDVHLWDKVAGGYRMHDFHDYQPSRETVMEERRRNAERAAYARRTSGERAPVVPSIRSVSGPSRGVYNPPTPHKPGLHDGSHPNCLVCGTAA